jgi:hypothetical protein
LHKANPAGKRWTRRWCVLTETAFVYYTRPGGTRSDVLGGFLVPACAPRSGWDLAGPTPTPHVFTVTQPPRHFYFCADDAEQQQQWLDALSVAVEAEVGGGASGGGSGSGDGSGSGGGTPDPDALPLGSADEGGASIGPRPPAGPLRVVVVAAGGTEAIPTRYSVVIPEDKVAG